MRGEASAVSQEPLG